MNVLTPQFSSVGHCSLKRREGYGLFVLERGRVWPSKGRSFCEFCALYRVLSRLSWEATIVFEGLSLFSAQGEGPWKEDELASDVPLWRVKFLGKLCRVYVSWQSLRRGWNYLRLGTEAVDMWVEVNWTVCELDWLLRWTTEVCSTKEGLDSCLRANCIMILKDKDHCE